MRSVWSFFLQLDAVDFKLFKETVELIVVSKAKNSTASMEVQEPSVPKRNLQHSVIFCMFRMLKCF